MVADVSSEREKHIFRSSPQERERRYLALRAAMRTDGIEALIVAARGDECTRGRLQYISDAHMWAGRALVAFPLSGTPAYFGAPLWGSGRVPMPGWLTDARNSEHPGRDLGHALRDLGLGRARIGIVGLEDVIAVVDMKEITAALPDAELIDATELFDAVRSIKSPEEIGYLRETSVIVKKAYEVIEAHLAPGRTEREVIAEAHKLLRGAGCLDGIAILGRQPFHSFAPPTDDAFTKDDIIGMDLEWGGPSHYWLELRRVYSFKQPPDDALRFWDMRVEAQQRCLEAIKPGVSSNEILIAMQAVYRKYGYDADGIVGFSAHGIGIDCLELPYVPGKEVMFQEGMVVSLHPQVRFATPLQAQAFGGLGIADNVLVTASGSERLTDQVDEWIIV
ncbi:MAG: pepE [Chloroflexi bacterium]|nr:pepE [Chloroflexota bacterium]